MPIILAIPFVAVAFPPAICIASIIYGHAIQCRPTIRAGWHDLAMVIVGEVLLVGVAAFGLGLTH